MTGRDLAQGIDARSGETRLRGSTLLGESPVRRKRGKGFGRTATVIVTLLGMAGIIVGVLG